MDAGALDPVLRSVDAARAQVGSATAASTANVGTNNTNANANANAGATPGSAGSSLSSITTAASKSSSQWPSQPQTQSQAHAYAHPQQGPEAAPSQSHVRSPQTSTPASTASGSQPSPAVADAQANSHSQSIPEDCSSTPGAHAPDNNLSSNEDTQHPSDPPNPHANSNKKPRACESCRSLKVRCDSDPSDPEGPCRRCVKARRQCVVTQPTRKRQKKTDSRVAELERKIDALAASLHASRGGLGAGYAVLEGGSAGLFGSGVGNGGPGGAGDAQEQRGLGGSVSGVGGGRYVNGSEIGRSSPAAVTTSTAPPPTESRPAVAGPTQQGTKRKFDERRDCEEGGLFIRGPCPSMAPPSSAPDRDDTLRERLRERELNHPQQDIVDRGIITMTLATELFARYNLRMCQHLPGVVFPPTMTAAELRATKPTLFLSVMAAASSELPNLQRTLTKELMVTLAEKIIVLGNKSLELVQALQVAVIWYWPPERFEELKFYQLVHVAAVMAIDLGLGRRKQARHPLKSNLAISWRDHPLRKSPLPDPTTIEARRAWVTCYFLATNTAMALHRPNLIRWSPFLAECIDVLETSPDAAPTDRLLCQLILAHKLAEEVGVQFSMDDFTTTPNIADARTQYVLRGFERELERLQSATPKELQQPSLRMSYHVLSLYMHEIVTHHDPYDDCKMNATGDVFLGSDAPLTVAHINALSACLTAIDGIFDVFLSLDVATIRCLPVFNFVRVAYAVVVLIKMYFAASSPNSELGKVINRDNMKVEQHLEALHEKFRATAADERSRPAAKFLVVLSLIRSWFDKHKQSGHAAQPPPSSAGTPPTPYPQKQSNGERTGSSTPALPPSLPPQQPTYSAAASTPLQLLSEIATNNSAASAAAAAAAATAAANSTRSASDLLSSSSTSAPVAHNPWLRQHPVYDSSAPSSSNNPPATSSIEPLPSSSTTPPFNTTTLPQHPHPSQSGMPSHSRSATAQGATQPSAAAGSNFGTTTASSAPTPGNPFNTTTTWSSTAPPSTATQPQSFPTLNPLPFFLSINSAADFDYDYANLGDGFARAMDLTLSGWADTSGMFPGIGSFGFGAGAGGYQTAMDGLVAGSTAGSGGNAEQGASGGYGF